MAKSSKRGPGRPPKSEVKRGPGRPPSKSKKGPGRPSSGNSNAASSKFLICPETSDKVFVATATLADIRHPPSAQKRKCLYKVPSAKIRKDLYDELAICMEDMESRLLPKYGGRPWSVVCRVQDGSNKSSPFFRWFRGKLELAVLPHLLEKIPEPPKFPGYVQTPNGVVRQSIASIGKRTPDSDDEENSKNSDDNSLYENLTEEELQRMESLQGRDISSLSQVAWDHRNDSRRGAPLPTITLKWTCPLRQIFGSRKAAWDHALELAKAEQFIDRLLHGKGKNGVWLKPFRPTRKQALEVGKMRFLRDGLWVVGQEQNWQNDRYIALEEQYQREEELREKQAANPDNEKTSAPVQKKRRFTGHQLFVKVHREKNKPLKKIREMWKNDTSKEEQEKWDVKAQTSFQRRLDDDDNARWELANRSNSDDESESEEDETDEVEAEEPAQRDMDGENNEMEQSANNDDTVEDEEDSAAVVATDIERSFMEVLSEQEVEVLQKKVKAASTSITRKLSKPITYYEVYQRRVVETYSNRTLEEYEKVVSQKLRGGEKTKYLKEQQHQRDMVSQGSKLFNAETYREELENFFKAKFEEYATEQASKARYEGNGNRGSAVESLEIAISPTKSKPVLDHKQDEEAEVGALTSRQLENPGSNAAGVGVAQLPTHHFTPISPSPPLVEPHPHGSPPPSTMEDQKPAAINNETKEVDDASKQHGSHEMEEQKQTVSGSEASGAESERSSDEESEEEEEESEPYFIPTNDYCLNDDQIKLCMDASMQHFDDVMRTVKAKDLTRELADGFDVLRERGRGRYDMELPVFEKKEFDFLNDVRKAPWMPIVRKVLGDDAVLIHKGCFLSLPGAANQKYHQDGVHLQTNSQRPCHAVNVFTPLVDMTLEHGPTEFCLGSHVLGQEDWDRRYIETPISKKGVPIMFDYRLGHRGLANTSKDPRPIVYCTYARARDGKEFRDSVNFSRRRYRKLGEIVDKPMTREERSLKRRLQLDPDL